LRDAADSLPKSCSAFSTTAPEQPAIAGPEIRERIRARKSTPRQLPPQPQTRRRLLQGCIGPFGSHELQQLYTTHDSHVLSDGHGPEYKVDLTQTEHWQSGLRCKSVKDFPYGMPVEIEQYIEKYV
jgi:hypothetical protein